jgi:hypothetical protein
LKSPTNRHETREGWLRAATTELRPYFESVGYPLPDSIRFAIAFTSTGRKGSRIGECWHSSNSADRFFEIFIRADLDDPVMVLAVLTKELVHAALPNDAGHGKQFREAAIKMGLVGPMRTAEPGQLLRERLTKLASDLGTLPHARLDINNTPFSAIAVDRPKKQKTRMLKAWCGGEGCGYVLRVPAKWVRKPGPPHCPVHGAMRVDLPPGFEHEAEHDGPQESV